VNIKEKSTTSAHLDVRSFSILNQRNLYEDLLIQPQNEQNIDIVISVYQKLFNSSLGHVNTQEEDNPLIVCGEEGFVIILREPSGKINGDASRG